MSSDTTQNLPWTEALLEEALVPALEEDLFTALVKVAKEENSRFVSVRVERSGEEPEIAEHHEGPFGEELAKVFSYLNTEADIPKPNKEAIDVMKQLVGEKYRLIIAYINYGDQLRAVYRDGIHQHFQEHIEEERQQAYELAKKLTALGEDAPTAHDPIPHVPLGDARAIFKTLLELEESGVALYQQLFDLSKHDAALNGLAQNGALQDQQHADDMLRYLRADE